MVNIHIPVFYEQMMTELNQTLSELETEEIDGLIIDIRDNPGGAVSALISMLSRFIPSGEVVFTNVNILGHEIPNLSGSVFDIVDVEVVILINENSASASEVFAAAMKEVGNTEIIGTTSHKKGTAQLPVHFRDNIINLTFNEYLSPLGNRIEGYGVTPSIYVKQADFHSFSPLHLGINVILEYDTVDSRTANAQLILDLLGYEVNRTDGFFDTSTVDAVREFQQNNNLTETGYLNAETATALSLALLEKQNNPTYDTQLQAALDYFKQ